MTGPGSYRRAACVHALCFAFTCLAVGAGAATSPGIRKVTGILVAAEGRGVAIGITSPGAAPLSMRSFMLANPRRLVFDLQGASLVPGLTASRPVSAVGISQLRVHQFSADPAVARLVLDFDGNLPAPTWSVRPGAERGDTVIVLTPPEPVMLAPPTVEARGKRVEVRLAGAGGLPRRGGCLDDPPRVFFDVLSATTPATTRQALTSGPVREVRMAPRTLPGGTPTVRLVVELAEPRLFSEAAVGDDLVITLEEAPENLPRAKGSLAGKLIVIDPGHGGADSGAPSAAGDTEERVLEKDITLDISLRLARLLQEQGCSVAMTREDDTYLPLRDRSDLANRLKADAFISVHCNSCGTPNTLHGTSVYYDHPNSAALAQVVQTELVGELGRRDNGIRNANFSVIRRTQCPGILVETAFINHDEELGLLADPEFREKAASGILKGVTRFFSEMPPVEAPPT